MSSIQEALITHSEFNVVHGNQINLRTMGGDETSLRHLETLRNRISIEALYNSRNRYPPCDPDTRIDVLERIFHWGAEPGSHSIYFLHGPMGSGKSAIAQSVAGHFAKSGRLAATFFFNRQEKERSSMKSVIPTIAYQLAITHPAVNDHICAILKHDPIVLDQDFEVQIQKLIVEPLRLLPPSESPSFIIFDALDECEDYGEIATLVTHLCGPMSELPSTLRFFITARHDPTVRKVIEDTGLNPPHARCDLSQFPADDDIRLYLERNLQRVRDMRPAIQFASPWPSNDQLAALVQKSSGLFIYAFTAVHFVSQRDKIPSEQLDKILDAQDGVPLSALDQLYSQVLSSSHSDIDELRLVLGTIVFIRFPLRLRELGYLLEMQISRLQLVLEGLHSILSIPEDYEAGPVTPVHLSLQEFLVSRDRAGRFFINPSLKHTDLAKCCLTRIRTLPEYTFSYSSNPKLCWDAVLTHVQQDDMAERLATRYACRYWSSHLVESSPTDDNLMSLMKDFCSRYAMAWRMFTEIDTQHAHEELARAQELAQAQAMLQRATQDAQRRRYLMNCLAIGMFLVPLVACLVLDFQKHSSSAARIAALLICFVYVTIYVAACMFLHWLNMWFALAYSMGYFCIFLVIGVYITVLPGPGKVDAAGVISIVLSMVYLLEGIGVGIVVWKPHLREAIRLVWQLGVVEVQQHEVRRCVLESRMWIHVSLPFVWRLLADICPLNCRECLFLGDSSFIWRQRRESQIY
jgi:NACHT domain